MVQLRVNLPEYAKDTLVQSVWEVIQKEFKDFDGTCYYKYPAIETTTGMRPDLTLFARGIQPLVIKCFSFEFSEIQGFDEQTWQINDDISESPLIEMGDFIYELGALIGRDRLLRDRGIRPRPVLAMPNVSKADFERVYGTLLLKDIVVIWSDRDTRVLQIPVDPPPLSEQEWQHLKSTAQGVFFLRPPTYEQASKADKLGDAIRILNRDIAVLDDDQEEAALQIAPGPQYIRGLAGTGKTVLLAKRAAEIHRYYKDKKILFTFWTQSLYNQAKDLISRFYRVYSPHDPDWELLHIRHAWGGRGRAGVYYDLCGRQGLTPLDFRHAKAQNPLFPFRACCNQVLNAPIQPEYDFILVDEAQDFPKEFL